MARIFLIGGHGRVALLLAPLLVADGHRVTAVIRNPDHSAEVARAGAAPLVADVETLDETALSELIAGHDVVVWSAGAGGGESKRTYAVDRDAAIRSAAASLRAGVTRFVMVSWLGSVADHGVPETDGFFAYADAKWQADKALTETDLDWTILGPGTLTAEEPTGRIVVDPAGRGAVSRADVAAVIAAAITDDSTIRRTIRFGNGSGSAEEGVAMPIAEALHATS